MPVDVSPIDVLLHGGKHPHTLSHARTCTVHTHEDTALVSRVCLTVSSLLPTGHFISTTTSCRYFYPAYFPGLYRSRVLISAATSSWSCHATYFPGLYLFGECVTWLFTFTESCARVRACVYIIRTSMEMQYVNQYFSSIDLLLHEESTHTHCHTRTLALTDTCRQFATDVCLTVSSLLSTESFMSTSTSCRSCQPAYFPGLHCLGECICVT